jgi:hypothetical protein
MSTEQQAALQVEIANVTAGSTRSQLAQVFSAALGEVIGDAAAYHALFRKYMGIDPLYPPLGQDCGGWIAQDDLDASMSALLKGGVVRFGYVPNSPFVSGVDPDVTGFDHDLAALVLERVAAHYGLAPLAAKWVMAASQAQGEAGRLEVLYQGLLAKDFEIAMSGQLVEAQVDAPETDPDWTCATVQLFTGIYYSGKDSDRLKPVLEPLVNGTRKEFIAAVVAAVPDLELRVVSASNPGPSPGAAVAFVSDISAGGGKAWCTFSEDMGLIKRIFMGQQVHFAIGDSNQNSVLCATPGFSGINLNIPAIDGQAALPLAAFTLKSS